MAGETAEGGKRKGGGMSAIISLVLVSLVAAGAGTAFDMFLLAPAEAPKTQENSHGAQDSAKADTHDGEKSGPDVHGKDGASSGAKIDLGNYLLTLPPIKGNLAPPSAAWARLELVVSFKGGQPAEAEKLAAVLSEDIVTYLRTVPISQFDSSTGLEHLRDDLEDVARIRTEGKSSAVIVKSLIVE